MIDARGQAVPCITSLGPVEPWPEDHRHTIYCLHTPDEWQRSHVRWVHNP